MAKRNIFLEEEEILRKKSKPVTSFDQKLWDLLDDMYDTMADANGVGLAAVQVGILRRVVVIDTGDGRIELINPEIVEEKGALTESEGCLSFPGQYGLVTRPEEVTVEAQNRHGKKIRLKGQGLLARAFCHEIDHLEGKVFKDLASEMLDIDEEERQSHRKGNDH